MLLGNQILQQLTPWLNAKRWIVGFSGGMDSTVLLHLLVTLRKNHTFPDLSAIYIHHGLQTIAETWPDHCQKVCNSLNIPLQIIKVNVAKEASIEQAARNARYQAFSQVLEKGDILLTAQHQNDQAETLLFRLVRGAGVKGLTAIPKYRTLKKAMLVRPLLDCPYQELKAYAKTNQLYWIEDPSNDNTHYARNYIRHKVIPTLQTAWPQAVANISQATSHLQEAQQLLCELAIQDLPTIPTQSYYPWLKIPYLPITVLTKLSWIRQKNALSYWLALHNILAPSTQHWKGWQNLLTAHKDATPIWQLNNAELHRTNNYIWLLTAQWLQQPKQPSYTISTTGSFPLPNNGQVIISGELPTIPLLIQYRQGGEIIHLAKRGKRDLKRLFNELAVPLFIRNRLPLLTNQQGHLLAIANFPQWRDKETAHTFSFTWQP